MIDWAQFWHSDGTERSLTWVNQEGNHRVDYLITCSLIIQYYTRHGYYTCSIQTRLWIRKDTQYLTLPDDVIKWKHFPYYWRFVREFTGHRWIPRRKASDADLWCFLWYVPGQTVGQTIEALVIWDAIALIMLSLYWHWTSYGVFKWKWRCDQGIWRRMCQK